MSIPEQQLETWSKRGPVQGAINAHESVRATISRNFDGPPPKVLLQGSYKNYTNIYADSDVDILAISSDLDYLDPSNLSIIDQYRFKNSRYYRADPDSEFLDYREAVKEALLRSYARTSVESASKCFKISGISGRCEADVVPCFRLLRLSSLPEHGAPMYDIEGIAFRSVHGYGNWIFNYPKLHFDNGAAKNSVVPGFRGTVRLFKNMRNRVNSPYPSCNAPGYFISCLLYNMPDELFFGSRQEVVASILDHLNEKFGAIYPGLVAQNEVDLIFNGGLNSWSYHDAMNFILGCTRLWKSF